MDVTTVEYLVYLRENTSQLRQEAKSWGFTEEEIKQCIEDALKGYDAGSDLSKTPKNIARSCFHYFLVTVKTLLAIIGVLALIFCGAWILVEYHEPSAKYAFDVLQPWGYQIFRTIRLVTLPVHSIFNITELYSSECVIDNPFYEEYNSFEVDCNICASYTHVKFTNLTVFTPMKFKLFTQSMKPVVIQDTLPEPLTYGDLRQAYLDNKDLILDSVYKLHSSDPNFQTLQDLFDDDQESLINSTAEFHMDWESHTVAFNVLLRSLFPRPKYIPDKSEISMEKHVFMDGPNKTTYLLPRFPNTVNLYTQGAGTRKVLLRPRGPCRSQCKSLLGVLNAGDSLVYQYDMWEAYLINNSEQISIGHMLSVS